MDKKNYPLLQSHGTRLCSVREHSNSAHSSASPYYRNRLPDGRVLCGGTNFRRCASWFLAKQSISSAVYKQIHKYFLLINRFQFWYYTNKPRLAFICSKL